MQNLNRVIKIRGSVLVDASRRGAAMRKSFIIGLVILLGHIAGTAVAAQPELDPNAPDRHIVVPGDTLWGISGRFLKDPWRWPELFELNKEQIRNPHRIYPGDVIVLDRNASRARVVSGNTVTLSPRIRVEGREADAIPAIPASVIEPFLSQPLVLDGPALNAAPRIVATEENRMVVGAGNKAYARGIDDKSGEFWQVFRPGEVLIDPDSKETLGTQAVYLGEARVVRPGEVSVLEIVKSNQEMYVGDRMFAAPPPAFTSYVPRAPERKIQGRIISAYGGLAEVGTNGVVTLNRGTRDGVEVGNVLAVFRSPESASNIRYSATLTDLRNSPVWGRTGPTGRGDAITTPVAEAHVPQERHGLLFVFRAFDRVSYALVMQASATINVLDMVQNP